MQMAINKVICQLSVAEQFKRVQKQFKKLFKLDFTVEVEYYFLQQIENMEAQFIEEKSPRFDIYRIEYKNKFFEVIYDKERNTIHCALKKVYAKMHNINFNP